MSEFDSLSDYDWLDVSSNRDSDTDSAFSRDSDHDAVRQRSRRSSASIASIGEAEVDAWEGFVDSNGDENLADHQSQNALSQQRANFSEVGTDTMTPTIQREHAEDELVKEALDQSLISTLSSSRSNSASTHNSIRDLRLSFPDPLSSSHDELQRPSEDAPPSEPIFDSTDISSKEIEVVSTATSDDCQAYTYHCSDSSTPRDISPLHEVQIPQRDKAEFDIVLYGSSSPSKWYFPKMLVQKMISGSGRTVSGNTICPEKRLMFLTLERSCDSSSEVVVVYDRTDDADASGKEAPAVHDPRRPTLAILYLPSLIHSLPEHTLYLPVLWPCTPSNAGCVMAEHDLRSLGIPSSKVGHLLKDTGSIIFVDEVEEVPQMRMHRLFEKLMSEEKRRSTKSISEHLRPAHAVTFFALVSLMVGFSMNTVFRKTYTPSTATISTNSFSIWGLFDPGVNRSSVLTGVATSAVNGPTMASSAKDFSLSVYNSGSTSLAITTKHVQPVTHETVAKVGPMTISERLNKKGSGDLVVRQTSQLATANIQSPTTVSLHPTSGPSGIKYVNGFTSVVDTISEALDTHVKSICEDIEELMETFDDLSRAIHRQTKNKVNQSKGKAKKIGENVQNRHNRARRKAKELRERGEHIVNFAGELFVGRTELAKKKAHDLSKSIVNSDAWRVYQTTQVEWALRLKEVANRNGGGTCQQERKKG